MPVSPSPSPAPPPVLALALLGSGLGCGAAGFWLTRFDLAGFVEQRITRAHGTISAETAAWLRDSHFPGGLLAIAAGLAGLGALVYFFRPALLHALEKFIPPGVGAPAAAASLAALAWYLPTLWSGYFRYDDFELLGVARDGSFWSALWQPHGDHVLPLTRVLAFIGFKFFGVTAWPYNLWLLCCLSGVLVMGMLLLAEVGVTRPAQLVFAALVIFWSPWAEMMTGYYILSTYLLIAGLSLALVWCYLRWRRTGRAAPALGLLGCVLGAPLIDVSGCYVIGACGVFLAVDFAGRPPGTGFRPWLRQHRYLLGGLAAVVAASGACLLYAYRVVNPGVFLGMAGGPARTTAQLIRDLAYLLDVGVLLSMVTPFVYARLPGVMLGTLAAGVFLLGLAGCVAAVRRADQPRRLVLAAMLLVVLGAGLMVSLGRPPVDTWIVRWAAKHVCPVYLWLCLLVAAGWDTCWQKLPAPRRLVFAELTVIALAGFVAVQSTFGLLGMAVAFPPFGYPAEIRDAGRRRAAVEVLREQVVGTMAARLGPGAVVPVLDGNFIQATYPSLFSYNLSHYRPFFADQAGGLDFVRNPAMQPWHTGAVRTVPVLRDAVSPAFLRLLDETPALRAFYYAAVPLVARPVGAGHEAGGLTVDSDGRTPIELRQDAWDPEIAPLLRLAGRDPGAATETLVTVVFWSERLNADWHATVVLRGTAGQEVDLRQVYAFSLSHRVANLRVFPAQPGRYWFRLAEAGP